MKCGKCGRDTENGKTYAFYYGKKGRSTSAIEPGRKVTTTPIRIAGVASAWICDPCVDGRQRLNLLAAAALFIIVAANVYIAAKEGNTANVYGCSALALFIAVAGPLSVLRGRESTGEGLAISTKKAELRTSGYDTFLTTKRYRSLREGS